MGKLGWRKVIWGEQELAELYWKQGKSCKTIGKLFNVSSTTVRQAMIELGIKRRTCKEALRGELSPHWKGGRSHSGAGYKVIYKPNHHRVNKAGYVMEHILVWEEAHRQLLPDRWLVHHLNGIKTDNRPQNLLAMSKRGHSPALTMKEVQKRLREVEALLAQQKF